LNPLSPMLNLTIHVPDEGNSRNVSCELSFCDRRGVQQIMW
jgi:hypothetical protein